jgi:hypothetical protein
MSKRAPKADETMAQALRKPTQEETRSYRDRIRELVEADSVEAARALLAEALENGNHEEGLAGWQRVLAPAKVRPVGGKKAPDPTPDFQWLKDHSGEYRGQWVALLGGKLLTCGPTLQKVVADLEHHPEKEWILLHRIH